MDDELVEANRHRLLRDARNTQASIGRKVIALKDDGVVTFRFEEQGENRACHARSDDTDSSWRHCELRGDKIKIWRVNVDEQLRLKRT